MRSRRRSALLALVLAALAALAPGGLAQRFAFVSTRVPDELAAAYGRPPQGEVFLYLDGSELRLTRTPHASEYDPTPSPGGRYVAFAALDHADEEAGREAWGWWLGVVEALTGREVARWELPGSVGLFRPAGGFQLGWLGQDALLAQGVGEDGGWEVYRFDLASLDVSRVGSGFGIAVAPGRVPALGELPQRQLDPGGDLVREAQGRGRGAGVPAQAVLAAGELAAVGLDRPCEVDEVHVLVSGGDVLELHAPRPDELARAGGVHGAVADELDRHADCVLRNRLDELLDFLAGNEAEPAEVHADTAAAGIQLVRGDGKERRRASARKAHVESACNKGVTGLGAVVPRLVDGHVRRRSEQIAKCCLDVRVSRRREPRRESEECCQGEGRGTRGKSLAHHQRAPAVLGRIATASGYGLAV